MSCFRIFMETICLIEGRSFQWFQVVLAFCCCIVNYHELIFKQKQNNIYLFLIVLVGQGSRQAYLGLLLLGLTRVIKRCGLISKYPWRSICVQAITDFSRVQSLVMTHVRNSVSRWFSAGAILGFLPHGLPYHDQWGRESPIKQSYVIEWWKCHLSSLLYSIV